MNLAFIVTSVATVVILGQLVSSSVTQVLASIVHITVSGALFLLCVNSGAFRLRHPYWTPSFVLLLSVTIYNHLSGFKYLIAPVYTEFETSPCIRLAGGLFVSAAIALMYLVFYLLESRRQKKQIYRGIVITKNEPIVGILLLVPLYIIYFIVSRRFAGLPAYEYATLPYWMVAIKGLGQIVVCAVAYYSITLLSMNGLFGAQGSERGWITNPGWRINMSSVFAIIIYISVYAHAIISEMRQVVLLVIIMTCLSIMQTRRRLATVLLICIIGILPLLMTLLIGPVTHMMRDRGELYETVEDSIAGYTYHMDLSDFGWSLYRSKGDTGPDLAVLNEAIQVAMPRCIKPKNSMSVIEGYSTYITACGWRSPDSLDYPDSMFSLGYMMMGQYFWWCLPLCITLLSILLGRLGDVLLRSSVATPLPLVLFQSAFLYVETDVAFMVFMRNALAIGLLYYLLMWIAKIVYGSASGFSLKRRVRGMPRICASRSISMSFRSCSR